MHVHAQASDPFHLFQLSPFLSNSLQLTNRVSLGLTRTIYIRSIYGIFGREFIKYTVIYGVYIRFWPTLRFSYMRTWHDTWFEDRDGLAYTYAHIKVQERTYLSTHTHAHTRAHTHTRTHTHTHTHAHTHTRTHTTRTHENTDTHTSAHTRAHTSTLKTIPVVCSRRGIWFKQRRGRGHIGSSQCGFQIVCKMVFVCVRVCVLCVCVCRCVYMSVCVSVGVCI